MNNVSLYTPNWVNKLHDLVTLAIQKSAPQDGKGFGKLPSLVGHTCTTMAGVHNISDQIKALYIIME